MTISVNEQGYQIHPADTRMAGGFWGALDNESTPELRWPNSVAVYERMRTDAQVQSVLRAVTLPILRTSWWIDSTGCKAAVAKLVAEDLGLPIKGKPIRRRLRTKDRFSWVDHLRLALLEHVFGHSVFETVYRIDDAGLARIRKLAWRPPSTITRWDVAPDGGLVAIEQGYDLNGPVRLPVSRLVVYVNEREGGNWVGRSLLRSAYRYDLLKSRMLRTQAQSVERNGMGVPVYTGAPYPENLGAEKILELQNADLERGSALAQSMRAGENAGAAIPNGAKLRMVGVEGALPDADTPIRYYDEQIARAVLAHVLNLGGDKATGSYNLSSTFATLLSDSLQAVADHIAEVTNQHVIEDLVDVNFGPHEPAPLLVHDEIGARNPVTAEAIKALIECGVFHADPALEAHMRQVYGLPASEQETP